jgi:hypothetical protein
MTKALLPVLVAAVTLIAGCIAFEPAKSPEPLDEQEIAELLAEPNTVDWEYPISPKNWYPGDEYHPEQYFTYYTQRCWPGCHDPNSQPRPAKY